MSSGGGSRSAPGLNSVSSSAAPAVSVEPTGVALPAAGDVPVVQAPSAVRWLNAPAGTDPQAAWQLFDGLPNTGVFSRDGSPLQIEVAFAEPIWLQHLTLAGQTRGALRLFMADDGAPPRKVELDSETVVPGGSFAPLRLPRPTLARRVIVEWPPGDERGPAELAFWSARDPVGLVPANNWPDRVARGAFPGALSFAAPPASAKVSIAAGSEQGVVEIDVGVEPRSLARAFLVYDLHGLTHFTGVPRSINGRGRAAVTPIASRDATRLQVEEIDPAWLTRGRNHIAFSAIEAGSPSSAVPYAVSRVRLVGVPHGGSYAAVPPAELGRQGAGKQPTTWAMSFEEPTVVHSVGLRLSRPGAGRLIVTSDSGTGRVTVPLAGLAKGWHQFDVAGSFAQASALRFQVSGGGARAVADLRAFGSLAPEPRPRELRVTFPLHGECEDGRALLRGFATDGSVSLTKLWVDDRAFEASQLGENGAFQVVLERDAAARAGRARLRAELADGSALQRDVALGPCLPVKASPELAADAGAPYAEWVTPHEAKILSYAGATLHVPAGAVSEPVRITIRPLSHDEATPADRGEVNVVPGSGSFKLGPAGLRFNEAVRLRLPYDRIFSIHHTLRQKSFERLCPNEQRNFRTDVRFEGSSWIWIFGSIKICKDPKPWNSRHSGANFFSR
jgi:hypothetical protein